MATISALRQAGWKVANNGPKGHAVWRLVSPTGYLFEIDRGEAGAWIVDGLTIRDGWDCERLSDALDCLLECYTNKAPAWRA